MTVEVAPFLFRWWKVLMSKEMGALSMVQFYSILFLEEEKSIFQTCEADMSWKMFT